MSGPGVDIVGDITNSATIDILAGSSFKSIFCMNLLEHVEEPLVIVEAMQQLLKPGGLAFVSVPYRFPYHPDPIDTLFRPDPSELSHLFKSFSIIQASIVPCGTLCGQLFDLVHYRPMSAFQVLFKRMKERATTSFPMKIWLRPLFETCVVLRKA